MSTSHSMLNFILGKERQHVRGSHWEGRYPNAVHAAFRYCVAGRPRGCRLRWWGMAILFLSHRFGRLNVDPKGLSRSAGQLDTVGCSCRTCHWISRWIRHLCIFVSYPYVPHPINLDAKPHPASLGLSAFLIASTSLLLLIGAGLFSKSVGAFERHRFNVMVSI